jgi:hypothetical protein
VPTISSTCIKSNKIERKQKKIELEVKKNQGNKHLLKTQGQHMLRTRTLQLKKGVKKKEEKIKENNV